ncbi:carbonic anhydrase 2-like protein [Tanacetum coccineum]
MIMGLNTTDNINSLLEPDDEDDEEEYLDCEDNEEYFNHENDEEFTFMYLDENNTPIPADKALKNKDIHPIFPLFDQNLLSHEEQKQILPINPQVNKVFVESDQVALSSTSAYDRIESRLKDKVGYSNSDGRDAFVFLKKPVRSAVEGSSLKGNGGKRKGLKAENGMFLGHEIWRLKDKVGCSNSDGRNAFVFLKKPISEKSDLEAVAYTKIKQLMIDLEVDSAKEVFPIEKIKNGFTHFKTEKYDSWFFPARINRFVSNILDFQPGEAFMARNIASMVPPYDKVEYILVIGHNCYGGSKGLMSIPEDGSTSFTSTERVPFVDDRDFIEDWIQCTPSVRMEAVNVSLGNLLSYPFVKAAVMNKTLSLKGGYYNFVKCSFDTWSLDYGVSPSLAVK